MITENLSTLHIHKLTQAQYERLVDEGKDDKNALYLTPDDDWTQSDWEEADDNAGSFIQNKPAIRAGDAIDSIVEGFSSNSAVGDYSHAEGMST